LAQAVEQWLRDGRPGNTVPEDFDGSEPKLLKNETLIDDIERFRRRGREVKATIHTIQSSCFPHSYCKGRMREQVGALAQAGTPV